MPVNVAVRADAFIGQPLDILGTVIPNWGSGDIAQINAGRSTLQVAPDNVRFSVEFLVDDFFNTTETYSEKWGTTHTNEYDPRLHDLDYNWTFTGISGDFTTPQNVLSEWLAKAKAKGPIVTRTFGEGPFTATVVITEPKTGFSTTATFSGSVGDPDTAYPTTQTVCINPVGDSDFTGAPAGAAEVNADQLYDTDTAFTTRRTTQTRWLFKRGGTYGLSLDADIGDGAHPYFGAYGTGAHPIISPATDGTNNNRALQYGVGNYSPNNDLRISGLNFAGNFDPTSETLDSTGKSSGFLHIYVPMDAVIDDCQSSGMFFSDIYYDPNGGAYLTDDSHLAISNSSFLGTGELYDIFAAPVMGANSFISIVGVKAINDPNCADWQPTGKGDSIVRLNYVQNTYIAASEFEAHQSVNSVLKLQNTPQASGGTINVHGVTCEGSGGVFDFGTNVAAGVTTVHNIIINGAAAIGNYSYDALISTSIAGLTVENFRGIIPNVKAYTGTGASFGVIRVKAHGSPDAATLATPNRIISSTLTCERTAADNGNNAPRVSSNPDGLSLEFHDLIEDGIFSGQTGAPNPDAPLSSVAIWEARNIGRTHHTTFALEGGVYATPAGSVLDKVPQSGSAAFDDAGGNKAYRDARGVVRSGTAHRGWLTA